MTSGAGDYVQRNPARQQLEHFQHKRLRRANPVLPMALFPDGPRTSAHNALAIVITSTAAAPASRSTRAHSLAVAPVVITSSTSSTFRPLIRSGYLTAKALWTLRRRLSRS